jgi:hypothetical protein
MFAVPLPFPRRARPGGRPRTAVAPLDAALDVITRPVLRAYRVRICEEDLDPPPAQVAAAFVIWGARLAEVERCLGGAWNSFGVGPVAEVRSVPFISFDLARRFALSLRLLDGLQRPYPA